MNLTLLKSVIHDYMSSIDDRIDLLYKLYQQQRQFADQWDLSTMDVAAMLNKAVDADDQFWRRDSYYPIESLLSYATFGPEMVRDSFKDLYAEHKDLSGRVDRFLFHMNWLEKNSQESIYKKKPHFHTESTVFQYLSFAFPEHYALYHPNFFVRFLAQIAAKKESNMPPIERFVKVVAITLKIFKADYDRLELDHEDLSEIYNNYPMLLVSDLMGSLNDLERK